MPQGLNIGADAKTPLKSANEITPYWAAVKIRHTIATDLYIMAQETHVLYFKFPQDNQSVLIPTNPISH